MVNHITYYSKDLPPYSCRVLIWFIFIRTKRHYNYWRSLVLYSPWPIVKSKIYSLFNGKWKSGLEKWLWSQELRPELEPRRVGSWSTEDWSSFDSLDGRTGLRWEFKINICLVFKIIKNEKLKLRHIVVFFCTDITWRVNWKTGRIPLLSSWLVSGRKNFRSICMGEKHV